MIFKTVTKAALAGLLLSGVTGVPAFAADDDGKTLYSAKMCTTCHGEEGKAIIPTYPKLNGQNKEYLVAQIKMIKDGTRAGGSTAAMKAMIAALTDTEIESIAKYLSEVE